MNKKCKHCEQEEYIYIGSMWWDKKHYTFVRCAACGQEDTYVEDE